MLHNDYVNHNKRMFIGLVSLLIKLLIDKIFEYRIYIQSSAVICDNDCFNRDSDGLNLNCRKRDTQIINSRIKPKKIKSYYQGDVVMAIPRFYLFHKPLLEAIADGMPHHNKDVKKIICSKMNLGASDLRTLLPSGKQTIFDNRYAWARTYLKRAGLLVNVSRSIIVITQEGLSVLHENPKIIDIRYLNRYESFRVFTNQTLEEKTLDNAVLEVDDTPLENLERAFGKLNANLVDEILFEIIKQTPEFFEHLVVSLLKKMGYGGSLTDVGTVIGQTGDEGIDGIIREDKLGFNLIYIQAKRWDINQTVSRPEIQKFVGALAGQGATKGLFITTARFSKDARSYADIQHTTKVVLVDGDHLAKLMIEHNLGVSIVDIYEVKRLDSDFFVESLI